MASGLWFAVIENGLYLNVYIQDPSLEIIIWRWTVCVLLHVGCTLVSGVGLSRVWEHTMSTRTRPKMSLAANWLIGAVVCHALYNSSAVLVSAAKELVLTTDHARIVGKATKTAQIDFRSTSEAYNVSGLRGHVGPFPWHVGPFPWAGEIWNGQINVKWRYDGMAITLTERAATEVQRIIGEQKLEDGTLLRVGVTGGGCSGFSYALGFDKEYDEKADSRSTQHGVDVIVDRKSALYLDGTTVDFYDGLEKRGFTFDNPNAVKSCGCGSSFQA
jgi:iron-sulfur cluster assembly accessory protein